MPITTEGENTHLYRYYTHIQSTNFTQRQTTDVQGKGSLSTLSHLTQLTDKTQCWPARLSQGHDWNVDKEKTVPESSVSACWQSVTSSGNTVVVYSAKSGCVWPPRLVCSECLRRWLCFTSKGYSHIFWGLTHNSVLLFIFLSPWESLSLLPAIWTVSCRMSCFCWWDVSRVCTVVRVCLHCTSLQSPVAIWLSGKLLIFMVFEGLAAPCWYTVAT